MTAKHYAATFLSSIFLVFGIGEVKAFDLKSSAAEYLNSLPDNTKIYLFPNRSISYQALGEGAKIEASIERYNDLGRYATYRPNKSGIPLVSILSFSKQKGEIFQDVKRNISMPETYKNSISEDSLSSTGCSFFTFTARETWRSAGIVIIDEDNYRFKEIVDVDNCIHSAFDIISGLPINHTSVTPERWPNAAIRSIIFNAINYCASNGISEMLKPERSRDGVTALPSLSCVKSQLSR